MKSCRAGRQTLGDLGPEARDAVPLLKKMLDDPHEDVRKTATEALAKIQGTAPSKPPAAPTQGRTDQGAVEGTLVVSSQ